jgi:hypothetical protein
MKRLRSKLTYSNVISTLCLFLLLGGGTAFAANQLAKKSVGTKQLKNNAVTTVKIKKNAVTDAKIKNGTISGSKVKDGALTGSNIAGGTITGANLAGGTVTGANLAGGTVTGSQIAGGTITGANINASSTPFSQAVARLRTSAQSPFETEALYPIGSYTQPAGEDDQYLASLTVQFAASCGGERKATAYLLRDAPSNFSELTTASVIGIGIIEEEHGSGPETRAMEFLSFPLGGGFSPMAAIAPTTAMPHSFSIALLEGECETGSGVTATGAAVDIIGTK